MSLSTCLAVKFSKAKKKGEGEECEHSSPSPGEVGERELVAVAMLKAKSPLH